MAINSNESLNFDQLDKLSPNYLIKSRKSPKGKRKQILSLKSDNKYRKGIYCLFCGDYQDNHVSMHFHILENHFIDSNWNKYNSGIFYSHKYPTKLLKLPKKGHQRYVNPILPDEIKLWSFKCPCELIWDELRSLSMHIYKKNCSLTIKEAHQHYIAERRKFLSFTGEKMPFIIINYQVGEN